MARFHPKRSLVLGLAIAGLALGLLVSTGWIKTPLAHPSTEPFDRYVQPEDSNDTLTVRFMGTSSLLFTGRDSSILMDGFVSRPGLLRTGVGWIWPDRGRIDYAQKRLGPLKLAAVFAGHAHYDHAMDAPVWARRTNTRLVGSRSTLMLGCGIGLPESRLHLVREGVPMRFGEFELTFIESAHGPPDRYPGSIHEPLRPPARTKAWKTGIVYSVFIQHRGRTILVQSTAGFKPGALRGRRADVVYLAIGGLGHQPLATIDAYWTEVVRATGARRVILVHWDDFFRALSKPLKPTIYGGDNVPRGMGRIVELAASDGVDVRIPPLWTRTDPFDGLAPLPPDTAAPSPTPATLHSVPSRPYCEPKPGGVR
ncbi:MAG TPA: MBL fold metallo-hydrolase [Longimicrobium sp.]|nr:MBL fold metallo-hydrolase [Longimicrobium sp.]